MPDTIAFFFFFCHFHDSFTIGISLLASLLFSLPASPSLPPPRCLVWCLAFIFGVAPAVLFGH